MPVRPRTAIPPTLPGAAALPSVSDDYALMARRLSGGCSVSRARAPNRRRGPLPAIARTTELLELPGRIGGRFFSAGKGGVCVAKRFLGLAKLSGRTVSA